MRCSIIGAVVPKLNIHSFFVKACREVNDSLTLEPVREQGATDSLIRHSPVP